MNHCIIWSILCKMSHFWYIVNWAVMLLLLSVKRNILHGWGHNCILWKSCKGHVLCGLEGWKYVMWGWALADMFKTNVMAGHFSFLHTRAHTRAHTHTRTRTHPHTRTNAYVHVCTRTCICARTRTRARTHAHARTHVHAHTTRTHTHTDTKLFWVWQERSPL